MKYLFLIGIIFWCWQIRAEELTRWGTKDAQTSFDTPCLPLAGLSRELFACQTGEARKRPQSGKPRLPVERALPRGIDMPKMPRKQSQNKNEENTYYVVTTSPSPKQLRVDADELIFSALCAPWADFESMASELALPAFKKARDDSQALLKSPGETITIWESTGDIQKITLTCVMLTQISETIQGRGGCQTDDGVRVAIEPVVEACAPALDKYMSLIK